MSPTSSSPPSLRTWLRVLLWTLLVAAALEGAWLALFAWTVRSGWLLELANRRPERVRIEAGEIRSLWPGLIEVDALEVAGRTARLDWAVQIEHARAQVSIPALLTRTLAFRAIEARGVNVRSVHRDPTPAAPLPPSRGGAAIGSRPKGTRAASTPPPKWSFDFRTVRVTDLREVRLDDVELRGNASGDVGFVVHSAAGRSAIHPSRLELADVEILRDGETIGRQVAGTIELRVDSWPYRDKRGRELVPYASGAIRLSGELDDRPLIAELLRRAAWIGIDPALSKVDVDLGFDHGELRAGSRLTALRPPSHARILDFEIEGSNAFSFEVTGGLTARPVATWSLHFDEFSVHTGQAPQALLTGSGLELSGRVSPPRLLDFAERTELTLQLGRARLPDLRRFSKWIPPGTRLELLGGAADVSGTASFRLADRALSGSLAARFEDARVRWSNIELAGRIESTLVLAGGDLEARRFDVSGTRFLLADFRSPDLEPGENRLHDAWWADLHLEKGELRLLPGLALAGGFRARLHDTSPFVSLFELKHDLPGWASRLLTVEDVDARGKLRLQPGRFDLDEFECGVYGGVLRARLAFADEARRGRLLLSWRRLAVGVGFDGDERTIKLASAREWFSAFAP